MDTVLRGWRAECMNSVMVLNGALLGRLFFLSVKLASW
jgi:hypothetical protein